MDSPARAQQPCPQYELIQPLDGPSIHADWLEERGEGFHHIGYVVESLERTTAEMEASGHPAIARIHSFGATGDGAAAYYDTAAALGFLVEAVELASQMPSTDFTCRPARYSLSKLLAELRTADVSRPEFWLNQAVETDPARRYRSLTAPSSRAS